MKILQNKLLVTLLITSSAMTASQLANADTIYGIYGDVDYWHSSVDGDVNKANANFDDKGQVMASVSVEHPVPFVPNVRLRHTSLDAEGKVANIKHEMEATSTDAIAYYEVLDNVVSLDLGLGAKRLDGDYKVLKSSTGLNETMPMAYASVGGDLPFTGFSAKAELAVAKGSDSDVKDAQAEVKYNFVDNMAVDLGAKVGYRVMEVNYDDDKVKIDSDFKGPYVGVVKYG